MPKLKEEDRLIPLKLRTYLSNAKNHNFYDPTSWTFLEPLAQQDTTKGRRLISLGNLQEIDIVGANLAAARIFQSLKQLSIELPSDRKTKDLLLSHPFLQNVRWQESLFPQPNSNQSVNPKSIYIPFERIFGREKGTELFLDNVRGFLIKESIGQIAPNLELMLFEITKNTFDHSTKDGVLAMEVIDGSRLLFSYTENDIGFSRSIREFFRKDSKYSGRVEKGAWTDLLHLLFYPGFTTKPDSGRNKGMGFTIICQCAAGLNADLYLSDAKSFHYLTQEDFVSVISTCGPSHRLLRQCSLSFGHKVPLSYVGNINLEGTNSEGN